MATGDQLFVLCTRPGLIRGGVAHAGCKAHPLDAFTRDQLTEMLREPAISLVVGRRVTLSNLDDLNGLDADVQAAEVASGAAPTKSRAAR